MDTSLPNYYRMGIRLRQAHLAHAYACPTGDNRFLAAEEKLSVKHTLIRLGAAFELWSQTVDLGSTKQSGEAIIGKASEDWEATCKRSYGERNESNLHVRIHELEVLCREFVLGLRHQRPEHETWFQLGLEIVQVEDHQDYNKPGDSKPIWKWKNRRRLDELLAKVHAELKQLFPDLKPNDPVYDELPKDWRDSTQMRGWFRVEAGLKALITPGSANVAAPRRCYERDHEFLKLYNDKKSATYLSPAKIRDYWNSRHPNRKVTIDVVKKGIDKARQELPRQP